MQRNTLCKAERLCSKLQINKLFGGEAKSFAVYPLRVVYMPVEKKKDAAASILVSVSKKRFKRAVKRNRVKRQLRETYRKNKHELLHFLQERTEGLAIAFIYLSDEFITSAELEKKMITSLTRIIEKSA